jgi:hypothetical protein
MRPRALATLAVLCISWTAATVILGGSVPVGVYAIVEKVVLEPNDAHPQRIQIWGAFSLAERTRSARFGPAQRGYLYYNCPEGQETICRNEWSDIKSTAGTGQLLAFGDRNRPTDRVRAADEKPTSPSAYPIQMGVFKMGSGDGPDQIKARLAAVLSPR